MISIVQAACDATKRLGLQTVGLLGTGFTMRSRFYPDVFSKEGITLIVPQPTDQAYVHEKYMSELLNGVFLPETREKLLDVVEHMKERDGIQGIILGGTELPLINYCCHREGIPVLDTTRIHVESVVTRLLQ